MLQQNFAAKIETNQILKKKENMEKLLQNFRTPMTMPEEIETGVVVKVKKKTQKVVSMVHLPHMKRNIIQVKYGQNLINKGSIQNIRLREDKYFISLYEDTKNKMCQNFKLGKF